MHQPVMVHRALFGSVERFFGVLIEHYAGAFPLWLAPVQVGLVPISTEKHMGYAREVKAKLEAAGMRVELDERNDVMKAKIRDFATAKVPFILIMGDKEAASGEVSVRVRGKGDEGGVPLEAFIERYRRLISSKQVDLA
jgi:threonyl-tRNA synthetase